MVTIAETVHVKSTAGPGFAELRQVTFSSYKILCFCHFEILLRTGNKNSLKSGLCRDCGIICKPVMWCGAMRRENSTEAEALGCLCANEPVTRNGLARFPGKVAPQRVDYGKGREGPVGCFQASQNRVDQCR